MQALLTRCFSLASDESQPGFHSCKLWIYTQGTTILTKIPGNNNFIQSEKMLASRSPLPVYTARGITSLPSSYHQNLPCKRMPLLASKLSRLTLMRVQAQSETPSREEEGEQLTPSQAKLQDFMVRVLCRILHCVILCT
jgi:hypothetical protein